MEAGPRPSTVHKIPALSSHTLLPETSWNYETSPYPGACLAFAGQNCRYALGKVLGGSSSVNYMVYLRGSRHDFDRWEAMGNYGWGYDEILPLFLKMENATLLRHSPVDPEYRGLSGDLQVGHAPYHSLVSDLVIEAGKERGIPFLDINGRKEIGIDYLQSTTRNGRRFGAKEAYLDPVSHRRNLHVMTNSLVSKVIIDPETKMALGVEFLYQGVSRNVFASKEVIVSGGPINSPQLLWLSGIGPRRDLSKFNIPVLSDLPVGMKYLDHVSVPRISASHPFRNQSIDLKEITSDDVEDFVKRGVGKLTVPGTNEVFAVLNNGFSAIPPGNGNLELIFTTGKNFGGTAGFHPFRDEVFNQTFRPVQESDRGVLGVAVIDLYPEARGRLGMRGDSINHLPIIEYPFFKHPRDMETLLWGIKEGVAMLTSDALAKLGMRIEKFPLPDCAKWVFGTDQYWRCYIRHMATNSLHAAATNKMGPKNDPEAVVDPELRVYGIGRLRVADSSIAPTTAACHTQAISYVVGEKLAQLLKRDWNL